MRGAECLIACLALTSCGRIGFDAPDIAPRFGEPVIIEELRGPQLDDDPSLTADELEIYFEANRQGGPGAGDIWRAVRTSRDAPWEAPAPVNELNTPAAESGAQISDDGLVIVFTSARSGGLGGEDFYIATRADRSSPFGAPSHMPELSSPRDEGSLLLLDGGLRVIVSSGRDGDFAIYEAVRAATTARWPTLTRIVELDSPREEGSPWLVSPTHLVFHSDRDDLSDLYEAVRADASLPWEAPTLLPDVNSIATDSDPWLSADGQRLYFASNRTGTYELYLATRDTGP